MVRMTGLEPARQRQRNLNPPSLPIPPHPHIFTCCVVFPFGVPDIFLADKPATSAIDPGTRLCSAASATGSAEQRGHHARIGAILSRQKAIVNGSSPSPLAYYLYFCISCIIIWLVSAVFVQIFLTIRTFTIKIDLVWCALRVRFSPRRFIFIPAKAGGKRFAPHGVFVLIYNRWLEPTARQFYT